MATVTTAKRTARKPATKAASATETASETATVSQVNPDVYVAPTGLTDGFTSNGQGPALDRLTPRALENLKELATDGNTDQAKAYWTKVLSHYGVKL